MGAVQPRNFNQSQMAAGKVDGGAYQKNLLKTAN